MRLALAIASIVALTVHGFVFYDQFFHKWERHQNAYFDQARSRATSESEKAELAQKSPKIEQIMVTQFGETRVDRCTTCHVAIDDPRFKDYSQPLKVHTYSSAMGDRMVNGKWERRHKFSDFGCTVCHDGQGRGLDNFYSHGEDPFWPEPLLGFVTQKEWREEFKKKLMGREYMEANCAQCHTQENFAGTPNLNKGRQLFFAKNCYGCHKIEGLSDGTLGPELTEVGKKWKLDYLWESIVDPRANLATSFMPKFTLTAEEVRSLAIFLKSRRGLNFNETSLDRYRAHLGVAKVENGSGLKAMAGDQKTAGAQLVKDRACAACHKLGDIDGGIAPDLSFAGLMKDEKWIADHFRNPRAVTPDSIMPAFRFSGPDFDAMTAYLVNLKTPPKLESPAATYKALCLRCHGEKGNGAGPVATYLDPYPRDLTKAGFFNSKPKERFLKSIKEGVGGTSMPSWAKVLNDGQITGLFDYVQATFIKDARREQKNRKLPEKNPIASSPESITRGETVYQARCNGCHGRKADGKGPNALDILPRPRNLRNSFFVNTADDKRLMESILYGVQGSAMPPWIDIGITQNDAGDILNYIRSLNPRR